MKGRGGLLSFSLPSPKENDWLGRGTYSGTLMRMSKHGKNLAVDGPGAEKIKVCSCYTNSSIMSSKMRKSRHLRKISNHAKFMRKLHYSPL